MSLNDPFSISRILGTLDSWWDQAVDFCNALAELSAPSCKMTLDDYIRVCDSFGANYEQIDKQADAFGKMALWRSVGCARDGSTAIPFCKKIYNKAVLNFYRRKKAEVPNIANYIYSVEKSEETLFNVSNSAHELIAKTVPGCASIPRVFEEKSWCDIDLDFVENAKDPKAATRCIDACVEESERRLLGLFAEAPQKKKFTQLWLDTRVASYAWTGISWARLGVAFDEEDNVFKKTCADNDKLKLSELGLSKYLRSAEEDVALYEACHAKMIEVELAIWTAAIRGIEKYER